ncbi:MAG: glycosyltransferase family 1 protein [Planctomycetota bacterium]|nr:glycosyltransferase family 1 protein [Planctomycetota bacterium]
MKVGFDIRPALFDFAGIGRYVRELAVALTELEEGGPFMELFAPSWRGGRRTPVKLKTGRYRMNRGFLPGRIMNHLHRIPGLDAGRFPAKVDVFHWTDFTFPTVRSCATVMTLHDAAFAVDPTFHGWETSNLLDRVRNMLNQADIVIVPSKPSHDDAELLGVEPHQVRVIPHGVSPHFQRPEETPLKDYLLSVGTMEPRKNYMRTLQAMEIAWDKDLAPNWVIIGGEGWDHKDFLRKMASSRHKDRIQWIPRATDEELLRYYQGALALIHASLHEGFGLPVLEAMACGTAVVVSDQTSAAWVAGDAGMRVNPREIDSIAEGIERICSENWWRNHAANVLHRRAQDFTWKQTAIKTAEAYADAQEIFLSTRG